MHKGVSLVVSSDDGVLNDICGHNEIKPRNGFFRFYLCYNYLIIKTNIEKSFIVIGYETMSSAFFLTSLASSHCFQFNGELPKQNCKF